MLKRAHLLITGKVQGVWFRQSTEQHAQSLGLTGWVRNLSDGRVEAVAEGPEAVVQELVAFCHEGPPLARVEHVAVEWSEATGEFPGFATRR